MRWIALVVALALVGAGVFYLASRIGDEDALTLPQLRERVTTQLADDLAPQDLDHLTQSSRALTQALDAYAAEASSESRAAARNAWRVLRLAWSRASWLEIGRPASLFLGANIEGLRDDAILARHRSADEALDAEAVRALGQGSRGLRPIEILLFEDATPSPVLRKTLAALGGDLEERIAEFDSLWRKEQLSQMRDPEEASGRWADRRAVIDALVNRLVTMVVHDRDKILAPLVGATASGKVQRHRDGQDPSESRAAALVERFSAMQAVYGEEGQRLSKMVSAAHPRIDIAIRRRLAVAVAAMTALPADLDAAVATGDPRLKAAYDASSVLKFSFGTDLVSTLDTTLSLTLNDGD